MKSLICVFSGVGLSVGADILLKKSAASGAKYFLIGLALYALAAAPVALAYRITTFGRVFLFWEAVNAAMCICCAVFVFKEHFGLRELVAFSLIAIAIGILR